MITKDFKTLTPIRESPEDFEAIKKRLIEHFKKEIYLPLIKELKAPQDTLKNSLEDLAGAIVAGRLRFHRGHFRGRFNSSLSKELKSLGAQWDRTQGSWKIPRSNLPPEIIAAIDAGETRFERVTKRIDQRLEEMLPAEIADRLKISDLFDKTLWKVEDQFKKSVKSISVAPQLTPDRARRISDEWSENMKLFIKDWTEKEIVSLRKEVKKSALTGSRYESLIGTIEKSYGVSTRKAQFLARQETSLMMTKYKETRYTEVGVNHYRWQCVSGTEAHPVRPMHRSLNGKIFTWDNPPVTSEDNIRNNPGQDFNCRCVAVPLVRHKSES